MIKIKDDFVFLLVISLIAVGVQSMIAYVITANIESRLAIIEERQLDIREIVRENRRMLAKENAKRLIENAKRMNQ